MHTQDQTWIFWQDKTSRVQLHSGKKIVVKPGDQILVDYDTSTKSILRIVDFKERVLH